jgi:hypothetical protein
MSDAFRLAGSSENNGSRGGAVKLAGPMRKRVERLLLHPDDRSTLERWVRAPTTPQRVALRSRIVLLLLAGDGLSGREVARTLTISRHSVDLWRARYLAGGCEALKLDKPGRGRKPAAPTS